MSNTNLVLTYIVIAHLTLLYVIGRIIWRGEKGKERTLLFAMGTMIVLGLVCYVMATAASFTVGITAFMVGVFCFDKYLKISKY